MKSAFSTFLTSDAATQNAVRRTFEENLLELLVLSLTIRSGTKEDFIKKREATKKRKRKKRSRHL